MRTRVIRQGYLLGLVLACLVGLTYFNDERIGRARAEMARLDNQATNMATQVDTMYDLQRQLSDLMIKRNIDQRLGSRIDGMAILAALGGILPESMMLTSLSLDAMKVPVKLKPAADALSRRGARKSRSTTVNRLKLTIVGRSPNNVDVANFIADLSASKLFEEVEMGYAKNVKYRGKSAKEFQASCYVAR